MKEVVDRFRLGYVAEPLPGHEMYAGMLAIPYLRRTVSGEWATVSIRFRCLKEGCKHDDHPGGKYATISGDKPRLFNTLELIRNDDEIAITEGEVDAIVATACGQPAIGVPGANVWKNNRHFAIAFRGYETVYILADGDKAGIEFAETVKKDLPNAKAIPMPAGEDVNSTVLSGGKRALLERIKR